MNKELELKIINNYILSNKKERAKYELLHPNKRSSFIYNLDAKGYIERGCVLRIISRVNSCKEIYNEVKRFNFNEICYVLSHDERYDTCILPLYDALDSIVFNGPAILSSVDGSIAYFEGEPNLGGTNRFILKPVIAN